MRAIIKIMIFELLLHFLHVNYTHFQEHFGSPYLSCRGATGYYCTTDPTVGSMLTTSLTRAPARYYLHGLYEETNENKLLRIWTIYYCGVTKDLKTQNCKGKQQNKCFFIETSAKNKIRASETVIKNYSTIYILMITKIDELRHDEIANLRISIAMHCGDCRRG